MWFHLSFHIFIPSCYFCVYISKCCKFCDRSNCVQCGLSNRHREGIVFISDFENQTTFIKYEKELFSFLISRIERHLSSTSLSHIFFRFSSFCWLSIVKVLWKFSIGDTESEYVWRMWDVLHSIVQCSPVELSSRLIRFTNFGRCLLLLLLLLLKLLLVLFMI